MILPPARLFDQIEVATNNVCTRTCWHCKYGAATYRKTTKHEMSTVTIDSILLELEILGFDGRLSWYRINEPLTDKRMPAIISSSRHRLPNVFLSLNTNGDLLTQELAEDLLARGLNALCISIYDDKMAAWVDEQVWPDLRVNALDGRNSPFLSNRGGSIPNGPLSNFTQAIERYSHSRCGHPFRGMSVMSNGDAVLCCNDMYGDVVFGNLEDATLSEIWYNGKYSAHREALLQDDRRKVPLCRTCSFSGDEPGIYWPLIIKEPYQLRRSE